MSRNGSGTYTLPSGNPVVSGTLIEATWANSTLSDIATALTDSLSRSGQGGMTAAFRAFDGTSSVPGIAWGSETTTGWYRAGAGDMRLVVTGSEVIRYQATGVAITGTLSVSGNTTLSGGTANGVPYLNGSKVLTTGSALTFDGSQFYVNSNSTTASGFFQINDATTTQANSFGTIVRNANDGNGRYSLSAWRAQNASGLTQYSYIGTQSISGAANYTPEMVFGLSTGASSYAEQMRLTSTGLGIGTSSPAQKLDVVGAIRAVTASTAANNLRVGNTGNSLFLGVDSSTGGTNIIGSLAYATTLATNTALQLSTNNGASVQATLDSSGNLGLGVTPSASWSAASGPALQIGPYASVFNNSSLGSSEVAYNTIRSGSDAYVYNITGIAASRFQQRDGAFRFFTAPSGTAGNAITFTQAMTLDASGNLGVGTTSPAAKLELGAPNAINTTNTFRISNPYYNYWDITNGVGGVLAFSRGGSEWMRIDSSGNVGIGTSSPNPISWGRSLTLNTTSNGAYDLAVNGSEMGYFYANSSLVGVGSYANVPLAFYTNNTERARIDSSGNLLVGASSLNGAGKVEISYDRASHWGLQIRNTTGTTQATTYIAFKYVNTQTGYIESSGSTTSYITTSDYRLKENVQPMTGALAKVALLKPCTYTWKSDGTPGQGFIAHELQEVCADAVSGEKDAVNEDGSIKPQGIDTSFLVATLTAAIQEQQAIINAQSAALEQLKADVAALKGN